MKQVFKGALTVFIAILLVRVLIGCNSEEFEITNNLEAEITMNVFDTKQLDFKTNSDLKILYKSSNQEIAKVDRNGLVEALKGGEVTITASLDGKPEISATIKVVVEERNIQIAGPTKVYAGQTITLTATDEKLGSNVTWYSDKTTIATVDQTGVVKGIKPGVVEIGIVSNLTGAMEVIEITVLIPNVESIEVVRAQTSPILLLDEVQLTHVVYPNEANKDVVWASSDEAIATVDQNGKVTTHRSGEVDITATSVESGKVGVYTVVVEVDPIDLLKKFNVSNPVHMRAKSNLDPNVNDLIYGSVNLFWAADMNLKVELIPVDTVLKDQYNNTKPNPYVGEIVTPQIVEDVEFWSVRPGVKKISISNITFHDTGNSSPGATARMHAIYMVGTGNRTVQVLNGGRLYGFRSWNYTVDEDEIIQHIPDDEITFQGDTYLAYSTAIGIETTINKGSNLFTTWHRTAKLMSSLLSKHNLDITDIRQHNYFSGKDCPAVLRATGLYNNVLDMIYAEYLILEELAGYTIEFISDSPEYVDNSGRIIKLDDISRLISYQVKITNASTGYDESVILYSTLPTKIN